MQTLGVPAKLEHTQPSRQLPFDVQGKVQTAATPVPAQTLPVGHDAAWQDCVQAPPGVMVVAWSKQVVESHSAPVVQAAPIARAAGPDSTQRPVNVLHCLPKPHSAFDEHRGAHAPSAHS